MQFCKFQYDPKEIFICKSSTIIWPTKGFDYFYAMCELLHFISITHDSEVVKTVMSILVKRDAFKEWIRQFNEPTFRKNLQENKSALAEPSWMLKFSNIKELNDLSTEDIFDFVNIIPPQPPKEYEEKNLMIVSLKRKRVEFRDTDHDLEGTEIRDGTHSKDNTSGVSERRSVEFAYTDHDLEGTEIRDGTHSKDNTSGVKQAGAKTTLDVQQPTVFDLKHYIIRIDKKYHVDEKFMTILINRLIVQTRNNELDDNSFALTSLPPEYNVCISGQIKEIDATVELKYPDKNAASIKNIMTRFQFCTGGHFITMQYRQVDALWDNEWVMSRVNLTDNYIKAIKEQNVYANPEMNSKIAEELIAQVISFMTRLRYTISENIKAYEDHINNRLKDETHRDLLLRIFQKIAVLHRFAFHKSASGSADKTMSEIIVKTGTSTKRQIFMDADSGGYNPNFKKNKASYYRIGFFSWYTKTEYETLNETNKNATTNSSSSSSNKNGTTNSSKKNGTTNSSSSNKIGTISTSNQSNSRSGSMSKVSTSSNVSSSSRPTPNNIFNDFFK